MVINDPIYFPTFCKLLEQVVEAGNIGVSVSKLKNSHFHLLSRKINKDPDFEVAIQPSTIRDYRYIYLQKKSFSIRENRLDLLCEFIGYDNWINFRSSHFQHPEPTEPNATIRLLVLPDKRLGHANNFEGSIADLIGTRYEELKDSYGIENLEITFEDQLESFPRGVRKIREIGSAYKADLVVWPEYMHGDEPEMRVPFLVVNPEKLGVRHIRKEKQKYQKVERLSSVHEGAFLEETDILLFSMLGVEAYRQDNKDKALQYFEELLKLDENHLDALFYTGAIHQSRGQLDLASSCYHRVLENSEAQEELYEKASINLVFIQLRNPAGHEEAVRLLEPIENNDSEQAPRIHALLYQAYMLAGDKVKAQNMLKMLTRESLSSLKEHMIVMVGDDRVLSTRNMDPLLDSTIIHENESIIFLTEKTDLSLLSLEKNDLFHVKAFKQEVPLRQALIPFEKFRPIRKGVFDQYAESKSWVILDPTYLKIEEHLLSVDHTRVFMVFDYQGQSVRRALPQDGQTITLRKEDILMDMNNQPIEDSTLCTHIKLVAHDTRKRQTKVLYHIPGFVFMEKDQLRRTVRQYQSHLPTTRSEQEKLLDTASFVYQQIGVVPPDYLT